MKLGQIKIEALQLMFANGSEDLNPTLLSTTYLNDNRYRDYLIAMPGAINRAYAEIEKRGKIPPKSVTLSTYTEESGMAVYNLSTISDLCRVERMIRFDSEGGYDGDVNYYREGNKIITRIPHDGETVHLLYIPRIERVNAESDDDEEVELPEEVAEAIPYYVKSDLYRLDEPQEASAARNFFEAAIDGYETDDNRNAKVTNVYGGML